jgi:hypothetical protein
MLRLYPQQGCHISDHPTEQKHLWIRIGYRPCMITGGLSGPDSTEERCQRTLEIAETVRTLM